MTSGPKRRGLLDAPAASFFNGCASMPACRCNAASTYGERCPVRRLWQSLRPALCVECRRQPGQQLLADGSGQPKTNLERRTPTDGSPTANKSLNESPIRALIIRKDVASVV